MLGSTFNDILSGTYQSHAQRTIRTLLQQVRSAASTDYEQRIEDLYSLYRGHHEDVMAPYLRQYLGEMWRSEGASGQSQQMPGYLPLIKKIINAVSTVFLLPPSFSWADPATGEPIEDPASTALFSRICNESRIWQRVKYAERLVNLCRSVFLQPAWRGGRISLDVHLPSTVWAVPSADMPTELDEASRVDVLLPTPSIYDASDARTAELRYMRWTPTECQLCDAGGHTLPNPLFPDNVNHYGAIPVANWLDIEGEDTLYPDPDEILFALQILVDLIFTDVPDQIRLGAFGRPYIVTRADMPAKIPAGPGFLLHFNADPQEALAGQITSSADPYALGKWLDQVLQVAAEAYDIPADVFKSNASAVSKLISRWDLSLSRIDAEALRCLQVSELYEKIRLVWNYHNPTEKLPAYRLIVKPALLPVPEDELHKVQALERRVALGLDSPVSIIARERGISEGEARAIHERYLSDSGNAKLSAPAEETPYIPDPDAGQEVV